MNNYYKEKFEQGIEFQDFVFDKLYERGLPLISYSSKKYQIEKGENKAGFEIKYDMMFRKTGNFYIETHEKSNEKIKHWTQSGIFRDDNTWLYLIGDYSSVYIFAKRHLQFIKDQCRGVETKTSKGFLLPNNMAKIWNVRIINFKE